MALSKPVLVVFLLLLLAGVPAWAGDEAKPMIVKIHADWCGTCTRLDPTFAVLEQQLGGEVRIVVFDVTNRAALEKSRAEADRLGIRAFLDAHQSKTGTVGVLDATGKPVEVLRGELDPAPYVSAVRAAEG